MQHDRLPEDLRPYGRVIGSAVGKVRAKVTGASGLPVENLYQEARSLAHQRREHWEAEARDLYAYARADLFRQLTNQARAMLRERGDFGMVEGQWSRRSPVLDPASRRQRNGSTAARRSAAYAEPVAGPLVPVLDGPDQIPRIYGRSPHWARTFRETFPEIAEEFLALDDRERPATLSVPEFTRRQDAARARLRTKYAAEIAAVDLIEERREDGRLLRAMFGRVA